VLESFLEQEIHWFPNDAPSFTDEGLVAPPSTLSSRPRSVGSRFSFLHASYARRMPLASVSRPSRSLFHRPVRPTVEGFTATAPVFSLHRQVFPSGKSAIFSTPPLPRLQSFSSVPTLVKYRHT